MSQTAPGADSRPPAPPSSTTVLGALARFRWSSAALVLLVLALSGVAGVLTQGGTAASASMALTTPSGVSLLAPGSTSDAALTRYASQRAAFAGSDAVLAAVALAVPGATPASLRRQVEVAASAGANTVVVTADAGTRGRSTRIADAVVTAYREQTRAQVARLTDAALSAINASEADAQKRLERTPSGAAAQSAATTLSQLEQQASSLVTEQAVFGDGVEFTESAAPVQVPRIPVRDLALGLLVGLGLAAVVAWLRADRDPRVPDGTTAAAITGAPLLGAVREDSSLQDAPLRTLPAAAYRPVAPAMVLHAARGVVLVTASARSDGATTTALNLAAAAAREGRRVIVVDADLHHRALSGATGLVGTTTGVSDLITGAGEHAWTPETAVGVAVAAGHRIDVLPAGVHRDEDYDVDLSRLRVLLDALRDEYDLVVVDAAPLPTGGLPALLARLADSVLVVARRGEPASGVSGTAALLGLYGTPVAGVVLTFGAARGGEGATGPALPRQRRLDRGRVSSRS